MIQSTAVAASTLVVVRERSQRHTTPAARVSPMAISARRWGKGKRFQPFANCRVPVRPKFRANAARPSHCGQAPDPPELRVSGPGVAANAANSATKRPAVATASRASLGVVVSSGPVS
jgi:hypothetical protein